MYMRGLLAVFLIGCAHVDYETLDAAHASRVEVATRAFQIDAAQASNVRERSRREILRMWHEEQIVFADGEIQDPVVTPDVLAAIVFCFDPVPCEEQVIQKLDQRYSEASSEYRARARRTLEELPPSERLQAYERILASGHNYAARSRANRAWAEAKRRYELAIQRAQHHYDADVDSSQRQHDLELQAEQARVSRANEDAAAAILVGLAVVGAAAAAASSASGGGYSPNNNCPKVANHDSQGCCSYHWGIDRSASLARGQVMCLDGEPSPTCTCW